jgi:hypothetical protein
MPLTPRGKAVLVAVGSLLLAALTAAPQAGAATIYACVKRKTGSARIVSKSVKCRKGESKLSWNTEGVTGKDGKSGKDGKDGTAGKDGAEGVPGQPQRAVTFNVSSESKVFTKKITPLFSLSGVSVFLDCANVLVGNITALEASGPASTRAVSGMVSSRNNNIEPIEGFQQPVYSVTIGTTNTVFAALATNEKAPTGNVGHVNATITTPGAIIAIDTFIEVAIGAKACTVSGAAFSVPV